MRLKTKYELGRGQYNKDVWFLFILDEDRQRNGAVEVGTKKQCRAKMAALKRREFLSSISDVRESQRRELREGAE